MVVVSETGLDAEIWVNDEGVVLGLFDEAAEVVFTTRKDLIDVWGEHQADNIMRQLFIFSFGGDERLVA